MHFPVTDLPQPHSFDFVISFPFSSSVDILFLRYILRHRSLTEQLSHLVIVWVAIANKKTAPMLSTTGLRRYIFRIYHSTHSGKRRYSQTKRGRLQNCVNLKIAFWPKIFANHFSSVLNQDKGSTSKNWMRLVLKGCWLIGSQTMLHPILSSSQQCNIKSTV